MCGRITATFEFSDIRVRWNLDRDLPLYKPRFNIAPESFPPHSRHSAPPGRQRVQAYALGVDPILGRRPFYWQSYDKCESRNADGTTFLQASRRSTPLHYSR